ncbi:MAG: hypothetical protein OXF39_09130 [Nitrospira sp.]|nr:hypothetical protein [Nitrospira sp.]
MSKQQKFRVYLAGPISGCSNKDQVYQWRNVVKKSQYSKYFDFIDPAELPLLRPGATAHEAVEEDLRAIKEADGLLVNMWRESIGSAIGIVHAHKEGRPVVVADPNNLKNRTLEFYADAVTDTPLKAANTLLDLLRAETTWEVAKRGSQREPFKRHKLVVSIRTACRHAKCDDIVVPRLALPAIIERLKKSTRRIRHSLTTSDINNAVVATLEDLETDPVHAETVKGVLVKWKTTVLKKNEDFFKHRSSSTVPSSGMKVDVASSKSHATIWGKAIKSLDEIPSKDARHVFRTISATPGITRIDLRQFNSKDSRSTCGAFVESSPTPFLIEGKLYDKGKKGTMQTFQILVQDKGEKERIANDIKALLKEKNCWFD